MSPDFAKTDPGNLLQSPFPLVLPDWQAPAHVRAFVSTRRGGISEAPFADFNLAAHVGDAPEAVAHNRLLLRTLLPAEPLWLEQVHGAAVFDSAAGSPPLVPPIADAIVARAPVQRGGAVCAILSADCLPVLLCDRDGTAVAAAHAGWRSLAAGVLEAVARRLDIPGAQLMAWLGPAIGAESFEVGPEVRAAFLAHDPAAEQAFRKSGATEKWHADLYLLARQRLNALGIHSISGGGFCTLRDSSRFFSYRRDGLTGRMASVIWLDES
ncbi:MAG: peptidoglycan editing factor PgeF [Betaproteobacteria bacterium]|nr:peptidoglycan editing factor PgeF [Betaproteobacteria bacterium]